MWWIPSSFKPIGQQASAPAIIGAVRDGSLIPRFGRARRDPALAVLEGFHPVKHDLRFGAHPEELVTRDASALERRAERLAPDLARNLRPAPQVYGEVL